MPTPDKADLIEQMLSTERVRGQQTRPKSSGELRAEAAEAEVSRLTAQLQEAQHERTEQRNLRLALQQTLDDWQKQIRRLQSEAEAAESSLQEAQHERVARIVQQAEAIDVKVRQQYQAQIDEQRERADAAESSLTALRVEHAEATAQIVVQAETVAELNRGLTALRGALEDAVQTARHYTMLFHDETWKARLTKWEAALAALQEPQGVAPNVQEKK